jgi:hypothetical protein
MSKHYISTYYKFFNSFVFLQNISAKILIMTMLGASILWETLVTEYNVVHVLSD